MCYLAHVRDPALPLQTGLPTLTGQIGDTIDAAGASRATRSNHGHAKQVVTAIFQPAQPFEPALTRDPTVLLNLDLGYSPNRLEPIGKLGLSCGRQHM